jgi:multiple sugar transport system permease protein
MAMVSRRTKSHLVRIVSILILSVGAAIVLLPFVWMLSTSLKDLSDVFVHPPKFFGKRIAWENYLRVSDRLSFTIMLKNTAIVAIFIAAGQLITSSMAGFALSYLQFRGRDALFQLFMVAIMIPYHVLLVPMFTMLRDMKLLGSLWSLILPGLVSPFGVFLMRQSFMTIPRALAEAAKLDGCSPWGIYYRIYVPLSIPAMTTLAIFAFVGTWNDFLRPLIFLTSNDRMTLTLGIYAMQGTFATDWGVLMATVTLSLVPVVLLFLCLQDLFVKSVALTGLKS